MPPSDPLLVTARFDSTAARAFQSLRDRHFPAERNIVPAHLSLFHKLPGEEAAGVVRALRETCNGSAPKPFTTGEALFLGRGVALRIEADGLPALRRALATAWQDWLTPQDRQGFRAHVTIQNKVEPQQARALFESLQAAPVSLSGTIDGLDLWYYRGGPWERAGSFLFTGVA